MLTRKLKLYLMAAPFMVAIWFLFYNYVPWLIGRKPIEFLVKYNLENVPPPDGAVSFAINHGRAMYYFEKTQLELYGASIAFVISGLALAILLGKAHK